MHGRSFRHFWIKAAILVAFPAIVFAQDATSTSFYVRSLIQSISGGNATSSQSTSTSFKSIAGGGQTATGQSTSTSFSVQAGGLTRIFQSPKPTYEQIHYHWRNDDGNETAATSKTGGTPNTAVSSLVKNTNTRLRIEIANTGGTVLSYSTQQFRLEYGEKSSTCAAVGSWTDVGANGGHWDMGDSQNLTDGAHTTNIAVASGGVADENAVFVGANGGVKDTSSQSSSISLSSNHFIELEYSIKPVTAATDGGTYCFRVTNAGSATNFEYAVYPEAAISAGSSLTFTVDSSSQAFPALTPGTIVATTSKLYVQTNNSTGYNVTVVRDDATGTMSLNGGGVTYIPDKTAWSAPGATTTNGNATASTTEPLTLQFRIRSAGTDTPQYASAWWGTDDTTANARFAGLPASSQAIINRSTAAPVTSTSTVLYNINVPATQVNGSYSGSVTFTATANP